MDDAQARQVLSLIDAANNLVVAAVEQWRESADDDRVGEMVCTFAETLTVRLIAFAMLHRSNPVRDGALIASHMGAKLAPEVQKLLSSFISDMAAEGEPVGLQ